VLTIVDDDTRGAITLSGSGEAARRAVLDELLARVARAPTRAGVAPIAT